MSWVNYDEVRRQLEDAGLILDKGLDVDGRVHRCKIDGDREKRGWYKLRDLRLDGGDLAIVGSFGVWRGAENGRQPISLGKLKFSAEQREAMRARDKEDKRRAEEERKRAAMVAARRAARIWERCQPAQTADYLTRKGVRAHGLRITESGALVVPMCDARGEIHGLQFILDRQAHKARIARTGRDKEYWPAGLIKQGHYHLIGGSPQRVLLIAEGYATAASVHEACGLPVAVAFDAGNLMPVAQALHKRYPRAAIIIAADDDWLAKCRECKQLAPTGKTGDDARCTHCGADTSMLHNAGMEAAANAALAVDGTTLAPVFAARAIADGKISDWNDLHLREGLHVVRAQIEAHLSAQRLVAVAPPSAPAVAGGEGGGAAQWAFSVGTLLENYSLIYTTDTAFDARRALVIGLGPLRAAAGKGRVREWLEHPERKVVMPDQVGFDPTGTDANIRCNLWTGWPSAPRSGSCECLVDLLMYLCGAEDDPGGLADWVLDWLAYPLQNPGAKMQSALLVHGPEGTGKNTFFGAIGAIYGRYYAPISQVELESDYNGWASGKLFVVGNEVVQRVELYHQQGRLKTLVTEPRWVINEKFMPARFENNHANFVFFSNRLDIARLDQNDRRYCVIWTPEPRDASFYRHVNAEIAAGGIAALHDMLMRRQLGAFGPHSKPPLTRSKRELIELSMDSTDRFWRLWVHGDLDVPCVPVRSDHLYDLYKAWCQRNGIHKYPAAHVLLANVYKQPGVKGGLERYRLGGQHDRRRFILPPGQHLPIGGLARPQWLGDCVETFTGALQIYREGRDVPRDTDDVAA